MRSILLVPAHAALLDTAMASGAPVVVADLMAEAGSLDDRRRSCLTWLQTWRATRERPALYVRVHPTTAGLMEDDLDALFPDGPDGIVLPACGGGSDVQALGAKLAVREAEHRLDDGCTGIIAVAASSAAAVLSMRSYGGAGRRLKGLAWDRDALASNLRLPTDDPGGVEPSPLSHARTLMILVAKAAGVPAYDAVLGEPPDAVSASCLRGWRDGFSGFFTRDPHHIPIIARAGTITDGTEPFPTFKIP